MNHHDNFDAHTLALIVGGGEPVDLENHVHRIAQTDPARAAEIGTRAMSSARTLVDQLAALAEALAHTTGTEEEREFDRHSLAWLQANLARQAALWLAVAENAAPETAPRTLKAVA